MSFWLVPSASLLGIPVPETQYGERRRCVLAGCKVPLRTEGLLRPALGQYDLKLSGRRTLRLPRFELGGHPFIYVPTIWVSRLAKLRSVGTAALRGWISMPLSLFPQPSAQAHDLLANGIERSQGCGKANAGEQGQANRVKQRDRKRSPYGTGGPLHACVESTS